MPKKQPEKAENDARKYDNGDTVRYNWRGEELEAEVYAVRFQEDTDGILHSYQYIIDTGKEEVNPAGEREKIFHVLDSSYIIEKVK